MSHISNSSNQVRGALLELIRRKQLKQRLLARSFDPQRRFILDRNLLVAAQTTRRAGKSSGVAGRFITRTQSFPGCNCLYIAITREQGRRIIQKDILDPMLDALGIKYDFNGTRLIYTFPNGSLIYVVGADDEKEMKKALGGKYAEVVIDEAQDHNVNLHKFVYQILLPAVADWKGQVLMVGTPCDNTFSFYYKVVTGQVAGWSVHKWNTTDNPYMLEEWPLIIAQLREADPDVELQPWFQQMYMNRWVLDPSKRVYKFDSQNNLYKKLPEGKFYSALGIDLGYDDATAFTLLAYRDYDPNVYIRSSHKKSGMILSDVEQVIKEYREREKNLSHIIVDNAAKQAVEELKRRLGIPLIAAEKAGKADFIQIMNNDFIRKRVLLQEDDTKPLQEEYQTLIWDEKAREKGVYVEKEACQNHCADSALYGYRFMYHYIDRGVAPKEKTAEEIAEEWWEDEASNLQQEMAKEWWEREV